MGKKQPKYDEKGEEILGRRQKLKYAVSTKSRIHHKMKAFQNETDEEVEAGPALNIASKDDTFTKEMKKKEGLEVTTSGNQLKVHSYKDLPAPLSLSEMKTIQTTVPINESRSAPTMSAGHAPMNESNSEP
eukprot:Awhi_evm3s6846